MEEKLLELIQKIAEVKGDSNAEVELENKIAFETGKMEGLSLTEKESIVNTINCCKAWRRALYKYLFCILVMDSNRTEQLLNETGKRTHKFK